MAGEVTIRQAAALDAPAVSDILEEAAQWLTQAGMPLWREDELDRARVASDVAGGLYFLAECAGDSAGTMKFQLEDSAFWPDERQEVAAYIHRLAVRRHYAGSGLSTKLLRRAVERTHSLGRRYLRLDCEASRPRLRAVYERFGFRHHSDKQVGSYFVARYEYDVT